MGEKPRRWGGARPNAGRAVQNIHLDAETARTLRLLTRWHQHNGSQLDEHQRVAELIRAAWGEIDQDAQDRADQDQNS